MWRRDIIRYDDTTKMREMVNKLKKSRINESAQNNGSINITNIK